MFSRRTFIKGIAAGGAALYAAPLGVLKAGDAACRSCRATYQNPHVYRRGLFCPNCGSRVGLGAEIRPVGAFDTVPFPNRLLVTQTTKPLVHFGAIQW